MFESLRKRQKSISTLLLIGFAALLMVSFGMDTYSSQQNSKTAAIKVAGKEIDSSEFYQQYQQRAEMYRRQFGASFEQLKGLINLQQQTIDAVIAETVFEKLAANFGMYVGLDQVEQAIAKHPYFQAGFDKARWMDFLRATGMSEVALEEATKKEIVRNQISEALESAAVLTDQELRVAFAQSKRQVSFRTAELQASEFEKSVVVSSEDLTRYYDENREEYQEPRGVKLRYARITPSSYEGKVDITEDDIKMRFEDERSKFFDPKKVRVTKISFTLPSDDKSDGDKKKDELAKLLPETAPKTETSAETKVSGMEAARSTIALAIARLNNGEDIDPIIAELKAAPNLGVQAEELQWVEALPGEGSEAQSFAKRASYQKRAEEKRDGNAGSIFIAREIVERREKDLNEVRSVIEQELRQENAGVYMEAAARELERAFQNTSTSFADFAKANQLTIQETPAFVTDASGTELPADVVSSALALQNGERRAIRTEPDYYFVEVSEVREVTTPPLDKIRERVIADFRKEKSVGLAKAKADELLTTIASNPAGFEAEAKKVGAKVEESKLLAKNDSTFPLFANPESRNKLLALSKEKPLLSEVIANGANFSVVALAQEKAGDESEFAKESAKLRVEEAAQSGQRLLEALLENQKAVSDIWVNPEIARDRSLGGGDA